MTALKSKVAGHPRGKLTTFSDSGALANVVDRVNAGEIGDVKLLMVQFTMGVTRVVCHLSGCRGAETDVNYAEVILGTGPGNGFLAYEIAAAEPNFVYIPESTVRLVTTLLAADLGCDEVTAEARLLAGLEKDVIARHKDVAFLVYQSAEIAPDAPLAAPAVDAQVAAGLRRGEATRLPMAGDAVGELVRAVTAPGGGTWRGQPTTSGSAVVIDTGGLLSGRLRADVYDGGTHRNYEFIASQNSIDAMQWLADLLSGCRATPALVAVAEEVRAAGALNPRVALDLDAIGPLHDVAVVEVVA